MKLIVAIVKPFKFDDVQDALKALGVNGMTVSEVHGFGRQHGQTEVSRGNEYRVELVPKKRIEILAEDADEERYVNAIIAAAQTGKIGDGKVWVMPVDGVMRVRTQEVDAQAL